MTETFIPEPLLRQFVVKRESLATLWIRTRHNARGELSRVCYPKGGLIRAGYSF